MPSRSETSAHRYKSVDALDRAELAFWRLSYVHRRRLLGSSPTIGLRTALLDLQQGRRLADGWHLRAVQHHAAAASRLRDRYRAFEGPTTNILDAIWAQLVPYLIGSAEEDQWALRV